MSRVKTYAQLDDVADDDFKSLSAQAISEIVSTVNGQLEFDKNLLSQTVEVVFSAINTEKQVDHNLGKLVYKYFVVKKLAACDVYSGTTAPTNNSIYLKSTVATTVTLVLF